MKTKSPLPWFGSDASVAAEIAKHIDRPHVTIPFAGGLSILPHLSGKHIVASDLHGESINFYRVAKGPRGPDLIARCKDTLSHPLEIERARELLSRTDTSSFDKAWAFWVCCWVGRKGQAGTKGHQRGKATASVRRAPTGGNNATRIIAAAEGLLEWRQHFKRCEFEAVSFREQLGKAKDRDDCSIYVDPPWPGAGDAYAHGFDERDHVELSYMLSGFEKSRVLVRYGDGELVRKLYGKWRLIECKTRSQSNAEIAELWFLNGAKSEL